MENFPLATILRDVELKFAARSWLTGGFAWTESELRHVEDASLSLLARPKKCKSIRRRRKGKKEKSYFLWNRLEKILIRPAVSRKRSLGSDNLPRIETEVHDRISSPREEGISELLNDRDSFQDRVHSRIP